MLGDFTSETFAPFVGQAFHAVSGSGESVDLVLSACEETRYGSPAEWRQAVQRVPFSLLFHAPAGRSVEQQIWTLSHPDLGEFPLFLVPLGPDERGVRYEAVIS